MHRLISTLSLAMLCTCSASAQSNYWKPVLSGTQKKLVSVSFGNAQIGYISGADSTLLRSLDGGASWQPLSHTGLPLSASSPDIVHLDFLSASTGYAVVSSLRFPQFRGSLCKTTDSGKSWAVIDNSINVAAARSFFFDEQTGFVIGSQFFAGKTLHRMRQGAWDSSHLFSYDPGEFLTAIDFLDRNTGMVAGDGGQVYRTADGGATWDTVQTVVDTTINTLTYLDARTILAGSDDIGGAVLVSHDGGRTWQKDLNTLTFSYPAIKGLAVSARDSFIAIGQSSGAPAGIILWVHQNAVYNFISTQPLNAVATRDSAVAFVVGDSGIILSNREAVLGLPVAIAMLPRICPNPASDYCTVEAAVPVSLRLTDVTGRTVLMVSKPSREHRLRIQGLAPGGYTLQASGPRGETFSQKLIVR